MEKYSRESSRFVTEREDVEVHLHTQGALECFASATAGTEIHGGYRAYLAPINLKEREAALHERASSVRIVLIGRT